MPGLFELPVPELVTGRTVEIDIVLVMIPTLTLQSPSVMNCSTGWLLPRLGQHQTSSQCKGP